MDVKNYVGDDWSQRECFCDTYLRGRQITTERDRVAVVALEGFTGFPKAFKDLISTSAGAVLRSWRVWRAQYAPSFPRCDLWVSSLPTPLITEADTVLFCVCHNKYRLGFRPCPGGFSDIRFSPVPGGLHSEEDDFSDRWSAN